MASSKKPIKITGDYYIYVSNIKKETRERERKKIEPCWSRREGSMPFRDLRTVERTIFFCLKMESSSSWLLLVVVLMATTDLVVAGCNLDTGRVKILGKKKIDVVIQKTRAPIITIRFFYSKEMTLIKSTIRIILLIVCPFPKVYWCHTTYILYNLFSKIQKSSSCTLSNTWV